MKKPGVVVVLSLFCSTVHADLPPHFQWVREAGLAMPLPEGLTGLSAVMDHEGRIVVLAGSNDLGGEDNAQPTVLRLDPATGIWEQLPDLQVPRVLAAAAVDRDGRIIVFGGLTYPVPGVAEVIASVEVYEDGAASWSFLSPMPEPRYYHEAVANPEGDSILLLGGSPSDYAGTTSATYRYDVASDSWSADTPMSYKRIMHAGVLGPDGLAYAIGGWGGGPDDPDATGTTVERYDWATRTWELVSPLLVHPHIAGAAASDGCRYIYVLGGWDPGYSNQVERFDSWTGAWEISTPMLSARNNLGAVVDRWGRLYAIGGDENFNEVSIVDYMSVLSEELYLRFDAPIPGTILDASGLGTGLTDRLPGTGASIPQLDPNLDMSARPGFLTLHSIPLQPDLSPKDLWDAAGIRLPWIGASDFVVEAIFDSIHTPEPSDQLMIYVGVSSEKFIAFGPHNDLGFSVWGNQREYDIACLLDGAVTFRWVSMVGEQAYMDGDRVTLRVARSGGLWKLCWENHTTPSMSGCSPWLQLDCLEGERDLYAGVYYANPRNTTTDQSELDDFRVSVCRQDPRPPCLSVPAETTVNCRVEVPLYLELWEPARGASPAFTYPRSAGRLVDILPGAAFDTLGLPDTWDVNTDATVCEPDLEGAYLGFLVSLSGSRELPPGRHEIALLIFERMVSDEQAGCDAGTIDFRDGCIGDPPVSLVVVTADGDVLPDMTGGALLPGESCFIRGDADSKGTLTIGDAVKIVYFLFREESVACVDALDADDDGEVTVNDAIVVIGYLFRRWPAPPEPFPVAGPDLTPDSLACSPCQ